MSGGPTPDLSPPPQLSPQVPPLSPEPHPAFPLPESLKGMAKTRQYQGYVRQYEKCIAEDATETAETGGAVDQQKDQPVVTQFRVPKREPMSPPPELSPSDTVVHPQPRASTSPSSAYSTVPLWNSVGGYFIIYGFTPARIDPNTGMVVNSLTAPLPPGSQLAYVPPSPTPMFSPMMNPMMVPAGLNQQSLPIYGMGQKSRMMILSHNQIAHAAMQTHQQSGATATAVVTETPDIKPVVVPNGGGVVRQETGGKEGQQGLTMKREKGEMREMGDEGDSDFSEVSLSSSNGESSASSGHSAADVGAGAVKNGKGGEGFVAPHPPSIPSLPPPASNTYSSISGHPLATSSVVGDMRTVKKELLPNLDTSCGSIDDKSRIRRDSMTMSLNSTMMNSTTMSSVLMTSPMVDVGSPPGMRKEGIVLNSFVKTKEKSKRKAPSTRPEETADAPDDVTLIDLASPLPSPRETRTETQPIVTTPVLRKVASDGQPIKRGRARGTAIAARVQSESSDPPVPEKEATKVSSGRKRKTPALPSRGSARIAAKRSIEEEEEAVRGSARIAELKRTADEMMAGVESPRVKKIKKELLKFYVKHVIMACVGDEKKFQQRDAMVKKALRRHIKKLQDK